MKFKKTKIDRFMKNLIKDIASLGGVLLAVLLLYVLVARPHNKKADALQQQLSRAQLKIKQYESFLEFSSKLTHQKDVAQAIFSRYDVAIRAHGGYEQGFVDDIGRLCRDADLRAENVTPISIEQKPAWTIGLIASYQKLDNFLLGLERYYRVEAISMERGAQSSGHKISITISSLGMAVPKSAGMPLTDGLDVFDLYERIDTAVTSIGRKESLSPPNVNVTSDPMVSSELYAPVARQESPRASAPAAPSTPQLPIDGIYWDPETPAVVVEGKAYSEGDTVRGMKILKINQDSILVSYNGQKLTLRK